MIANLMCTVFNQENQQVLDYLANHLKFSLIGEPQGTFLIVENGQLGLADSTWPKVKPVFVDFLSGAAAHRRLHGGGAGQAVAKAIGLNKSKQLTVLDATAGLGRDAFVLASLGANVTLYERHPIVYAMLADGLRRLSLDSDMAAISARLTLQHQSLLSEPLNHNVPETFNVVYLDPMFPSREKSAKVKKDMAMFHSLVGADSDADDLFAPAYALAENRLVVKRPKQAPFLGGQTPTLEMVGKSSRFDVYSKKSIAS